MRIFCFNQGAAGSDGTPGARGQTVSAIPAANNLQFI